MSHISSQSSNEILTSGAISDLKHTRRGGKKRRGGVENRRRQEAFKAAQALKGNSPAEQAGASGRHLASLKPSRRINLGSLAGAATGESLESLPMTPALASMTPKSQAITIGQILLARALVSDILGVGNEEFEPLSTSVLAALPSPSPSAFICKAPAAKEAHQNSSIAGASPRSVHKLPKTPPLRPVDSSTSPLSLPLSQPLPPPIVPSPDSAKKLSKEDFQALINARVSRSISERKAQLKLWEDEQKQKQEQEQERQISKGATKRRELDRYSAFYRTPGGQPISFAAKALNTPPTPRFGGDIPRAAATVDWGAYEAVHQTLPAAPTVGPATSFQGRQAAEAAAASWPVAPEHARVRKGIGSSSASILDPVAAAGSRLGFIWEADWRTSERKEKVPSLSSRPKTAPARDPARGNCPKNGLRFSIGAWGLDSSASVSIPQFELGMEGWQTTTESTTVPKDEACNPYRNMSDSESEEIEVEFGN